MAHILPNLRLRVVFLLLVAIAFMQNHLFLYLKNDAQIMMQLNRISISLDAPVSQLRRHYQQQRNQEQRNLLNKDDGSGERRGGAKQSLPEHFAASEDTTKNLNPYQVGCMEVVDKRMGEWLNRPWLFTVRTSTDPSFWIKIHSANDDTISPILVRQGCFECNLYGSFMKALDQYPPSSTMVLDIGSNLGLYALGAAAKGYTAHAFEPLMRNWAPLCYSTMANPGFSDRLHLYKVALSKTKKQVSFELPWGTNPSAAKIVDRQVKQEPSDRVAAAAVRKQKEGVDWAWAIPLEEIKDDLVLGGERPKHVILKVDTEGHECLALEGAMNYLSSVDDIAYVSIEWSAARLTQCANRQAIFDLFQKHGLEPHIFQEEESVESTVVRGTKSTIRTTVSDWISVNYSDWRQWRNPGLNRTGRQDAFDVHFSRTKPFVMPPRKDVESEQNNKRRRNEPATLLQIDGI